MNFELVIPPRVVFGAGALDRLAGEAAALGRRAWLVTGAGALERAGVVERVVAALAALGVGVDRQRVEAEPDTTLVDRGARQAREARCELVIGLGGGSALDVAKAIAGLVTNGGEALDYLEVVGRGRPLERPALPWIAVPSTAGTGSEATRNAVLLDPASRARASLRSPGLLPRLALLDPELTVSLPREVTVRAGLDALIQLIEPYVSRREHPLVDAIAPEGIRRAARALPRACANGSDREARADMLLCAHWSGIALAHCGLGAAHAFAGPLGGLYPIPHGAACAAVMPAAMRANLEAAARHPRHQDTVARYERVGLALGVEDAGHPLETARRGVARMRGLCAELEVRGLAAYGVDERAIPGLVARARQTSSLKANPVELGDQELSGILRDSLIGPGTRDGAGAS